MPIPTDFRGAARLLDAGDLQREAIQLQCKLAIIHAFSDIESGGSGFLKDGRPKILHEARIFHLKTQGKFDDDYPNISSPVWDRSLYGVGGAHQWDRFLQAYALAPQAALQSCSIGRYQVMGMNFRMVGFGTVEEMWAAFCDSELAHLMAFGNFCRSAGLVDDLQADPPRFVDLAVGYNGSGEAANGYDQKLEATFYHYVSAGEGAIPSPLAPLARTEAPTVPPLEPVHAAGRVLRMGMIGDDVARLQTALSIPSDRWFWTGTKAAVAAFQAAHHLSADGVVGDLTKGALGIS